MKVDERKSWPIDDWYDCKSDGTCSRLNIMT